MIKRKKKENKRKRLCRISRRRKKKCTTDTGFLWWSCRKTGCSGGCGKCDAEGFICKTAGIKTEAAAEVWHGCIEYGKATQAARPVSNPGKDTILNRADSNVNENQTDELREQFYEKTGEPPKKVHGECEDECSLMDQVNDLMIMGYQANLSFERDFVAEGVEMLNRFELPDEIAGLTEVHTA